MSGSTTDFLNVPDKRQSLTAMLHNKYHEAKQKQEAFDIAAEEIKIDATVSSGIDNNVGLNCGLHMGQPTEMALLIGGIKANVTDPRPSYNRLDITNNDVPCQPPIGCGEFSRTAGGSCAFGQDDIVVPHPSADYHEGCVIRVIPNPWLMSWQGGTFWQLRQ